MNTIDSPKRKGKRLAKAIILLARADASDIRRTLAWAEKELAKSVGDDTATAVADQLGTVVDWTRASLEDL